MRPSSHFGPSLARILREQRSAGRAAWLAERSAVALLGGRAMTAGRKAGFGASVRASTTFGLRGGELCGCRGASCAACHSVGEAAPPSLIPYSGGLAPRAGGVIGSSDDLFGIGWRAPSAGEYVDIHSHNFCSSVGDWTGTREDTRARLALLYDMRSAGVDRMVISGMADTLRLTGDDGTPFLDDQRIDEVTAYASDLYFDFFIPFVRVFQLDDSGSPDYVEAYLAAGFCGVGELFVHGHGSDLLDLTELTEVCRRAVKYDVPVSVHWEIGNVDSPDTRSAAENFSQLLELLDSFPKERVPVITSVLDPNGSTASDIGSMPLKLILCHCGVGPGDSMEPDVLARWTERLDLLLMNYPSVYFDLAGMQLEPPAGRTLPASSQLIDGRTGKPTSTIGEAILERILKWPTRFMFGMDTENRDGSFTRAYANSVAFYASFLDMGDASAGAIPEAMQSLVKGINALTVLASTYTEPETSG